MNRCYEHFLVSFLSRPSFFVLEIYELFYSRIYNLLPIILRLKIGIVRLKYR